MRRGIALRSEGDGPADIYVDESGNLAIAEGSIAVGQHTRQRLMTFDGEWFLDVTAGVNWIGNVIGRGYDPVLASAVIKAEIAATDGVVGISEFSVGQNVETRELKVENIVIETDSGEAVAI